MDETEAERILAFVDSKMNEREDSSLSRIEWAKQADTLLEQLRKKYGDNHFDIQGTLDDIRDEASWPRF
jgi:hypothetical protein